ncbi:SgcJ/EcaC family oxidoreductase [Chryseolinea lacunae]|uniref:SgcJ/EcaC family oxidoreductase n=1 Tax=Chryseolinea lacunae TaxID=2801331 RepID=A0ABS1KYW7_9BACT|nr:SgcJ/EcaC family oxidoreductase [Chryseolinea lacunae]MBL0744609.1 SgcJ/EcaC family oxidoreductase [Chryseolinea lacunae]
MNAHTPNASPSPHERPIQNLYAQLLQHWNDRDANGFSRLFHPQGLAIGFDGSELQGREAIYRELSAVFRDHSTGSYVARVKTIRFLKDDIAIVHAVAGMLPAGEHYINPALNAIQILVATRTHDVWEINLFQNTPAQFHGRPELATQLTAELAALL